MKKYKNIVITGGAGFIGSHLAGRLISDGFKVTVFDNLSTGCEENLPKGVDFIKIDLGNMNAYKAVDGVSCDAVFHLAGQSSGEASFLDPLTDFNSHVMSTFLMLDWCRRRKADRFIYASSMSVYGDPDHLPVKETDAANPKTFYGSGKLAAEAYIKLYQTLGIDTTIFRLFSIYGPGQNMKNRMQGMVSIYLSYMLEGAPLLVKGSKDRFRDFVYINDLCDVWLKALTESKTCGRTYNIGSGRKTTVGELLDNLKAAFGRTDYPIEFKGTTSGDQFGVVADIGRIESDMGWKPKTTLEEGLKEMVDYEKRRSKR